MSVKDWLWLYERLPTFKCIDFETIWDQNTCLKTNDKKNSLTARIADLVRAIKNLTKKISAITAAVANMQDQMKRAPRDS